MRTTADRIAAVYEQLWHRTPTGPAVERTQHWAERFGYVEPWRWEGIEIDDPFAEPLPLPDDVDMIAVEEVVAGHRFIRLTRAERRIAVREMNAMGLTAPQIAERVGLSSRSVTRSRRGAA